MMKLGLSCLIAFFLFFSCGKNTTSHDEFCRTLSNETGRVNLASCKKRLEVCTPEELYDPGYTPHCNFAKDPCKKACEDFVNEVEAIRNKR